MAARYLLVAGIAGAAALAACIATQRRSARLQTLDDDREAEVIRRFAPALHEVWGVQPRTALLSAGSPAFTFGEAAA